MRALVVAPAQVQAQLLGRNVRERVVERLDVQPRLLAEFLERKVRVLDVPAHAEVGAVDLQDDAGLCHRFILVAHRLGDREKIGFLARVVVVPEEEPDHSGGGRAHEHFLHVHFRCRRLEIVDVVPRCLCVAHADRRIAPRGLAARAPGIAEHALGEVRELGEVLVYESISGAAETREAILHVGGVAGLRHLAVVHDVHARPGLLVHDVLDGRADARSECGVIDRHALFLGVHHAYEILRPRQAPGMGGEKALGAAFHDAVGCRITLPSPERSSTRRCAFAASASGRMRSMSTR